MARKKAQAPEDLTIEQLVDKYNELLKFKEMLNMKISEFKKENKFTEKNREFNEIKDLIYNYMAENNLEEYEGIKLEKVLPNQIKKEERNERKKTIVADILSPVINDKSIKQDIVEEIINEL